MTPENQKLREALKAAENIIVSALAHQPEDNDKCREHLLKARRDAEMEFVKIDFLESCGKGVREALRNQNANNR